MTDEMLIAIANRDCPGHQHKVKEVVTKNGEWSNEENKYVNGHRGTYGKAEMICLKDVK